MKKPLAALLTGLVLTGCTGLTTEQQTAIDNLTPCEKINALLGAYDNRFEGLKRSRVNTKYIETWTAKYNLIADNCQITALDKDNVTYRCVGNYEQQQQAVAGYKNAKRKPYAATELNYIKEHFGGKTILEIAVDLGRTYYSVQSQITYMRKKGRL